MTSPLLRIVLGSVPDWLDVLAYAAGFLLIMRFDAKTTGVNYSNRFKRIKLLRWRRPPHALARAHSRRNKPELQAAGYSRWQKNPVGSGILDNLLATAVMDCSTR
ncbi:MAG: hypothetical protein JWP96_1928 [Polaromonas sp.]|nr:hypothetical protein [Polaromonas sp.]